LNDNDALLIAQALKQNDNLRTLRLQENQLTKAGQDAIMKTIYDSTSLNSVSDCNHTCCVQFNDDYRCRLNERGDKLVNRRRKLYRLLSSRNREGSNVYHLNLEFGDDEPLALLPKVLGGVYRYSQSIASLDPLRADTVQPLSIMYEILRSWKMPELFEQQIKPTVN